MRLFAPVLSLLLVASGCLQRQPQPAAPTVEIKTIENSPITSIPLQPQPTLDDVVVPSTTAADSADGPRQAGTPATTGTAPSEEMLRKMNLPFAPAIAMDPVDGGKVSITPDTPIFEYKNRLYYFTTAKNRQVFENNPEQYLKERLAAY